MLLSPAIVLFGCSPGPSSYEGPSGPCRLVRQTQTAFIDETRTLVADSLYRYDRVGLLEEMRTDTSDGTVSIETFAYDTSQRVTSHEVDIDGDGEPEVVTWFNYGADVTEWRDLDGDLVADFVAVSEFDGEGRLGRLSTDENADGDYELVEVWAYDSAGEIYHQWDYGSDGVADRTVTREYNSQASLVQTVTTVLDGVSRVETRGYGSDGTTLLLIERDQDGDGSTDRSSVYERVQLSDFERVTVRHFQDPDEQANSIDVFDVEDGWTRRLSRDGDADGTVDYQISYTRDEYGNDSGWEVDDDGDDQIDSTLERTFRCE